MPVCEHCARSMDAAETVRGVAVCPYCGSPMTDQEKNDWIDVARVTNLAEAGFLADDLIGEGIEARIRAQEDFDVMTGSWSAAYVIQVPPGEEQDAATQIRVHVADDQQLRDEPTEDYAFAADAPQFESAGWRPVAVAILAGVVCFVIGQRVGQPDAQRRPPPRSLPPMEIVDIGRPLLTEPAPGQPRYRLSYHRRQRAWFLDVDADGDGKFESRQRYPAAAADW